MNKDNQIQILGFTVNTIINELDLSGSQVLINTINPHSYCVTKKDTLFREALQNSNLLIPDGIGIVLAARILSGQKIQRISGADLHAHLLLLLNQQNGRVFYLGSMPTTLQKIQERLQQEYPDIVFGSYSPPYKLEFSPEDNQAIIEAVNTFKPHVVFVGMTAPKQEKWAYQHKGQLNTNIIASIGAVFDFYAGTVKCAPEWVQKCGLEWLHRSIISPQRLGKRNMMSNPEFIWDVIKFKLKK